MSDAPAWAEELARDLAAELPALVPLERAADAVSRHPRTLRRAAERQELVIITGDGGSAVVPRCELVRWVVTFWRRVGA